MPLPSSGRGLLRAPYIYIYIPSNENSTRMFASEWTMFASECAVESRHVDCASLRRSRPFRAATRHMDMQDEYINHPHSHLQSALRIEFQRRLRLIISIMVSGNPAILILTLILHHYRLSLSLTLLLVLFKLLLYIYIYIDFGSSVARLKHSFQSK